MSEIKQITLDDDSDFRSPKPVKKLAPVFTKSRLPKSPPAKRKYTKKGMGTKKNEMQKTLEDNFGKSDVNPEHLQMAIALSKSVQEAEKYDSEGVQLTPSTGIACENAKSTLEQFGFRSNKPSTETDFTKIIETTKRKKKSRYQFVTPVLYIRTEEDRKKIIETKIATILGDSSSPNGKLYDDFEVCSTNLKEYMPIDKIFQINNLSFHDLKVERFYSNGLNLSPSKYQCGSLLKRWEEIPGRELSPTRTAVQQENNSLSHSTSNKLNQEPSSSENAMLLNNTSNNKLNQELSTSKKATGDQMYANNASLNDQNVSKYSEPTPNLHHYTKGIEHTISSLVTCNSHDTELSASKIAEYSDSSYNDELLISSNNSQDDDDELILKHLNNSSPHTNISCSMSDKNLCTDKEGVITINLKGPESANQDVYHLLDNNVLTETSTFGHTPASECYKMNSNISPVNKLSRLRQQTPSPDIFACSDEEFCNESNGNHSGSSVISFDETVKSQINISIDLDKAKQNNRFLHPSDSRNIPKNYMNLGILNENHSSVSENKNKGSDLSDCEIIEDDNGICHFESFHQEVSELTQHCLNVTRKKVLSDDESLFNYNSIILQKNINTPKVYSDDDICEVSEVSITNVLINKMVDSKDTEVELNSSVKKEVCCEKDLVASLKNNSDNITMERDEDLAHNYLKHKNLSGKDSLDTQLEYLESNYKYLFENMSNNCLISNSDIECTDNNLHTISINNNKSRNVNLQMLTRKSSDVKNDVINKKSMKLKLGKPDSEIEIYSDGSELHLKKNTTAPKMAPKNDTKNTVQCKDFEFKIKHSFSVTELLEIDKNTLLNKIKHYTQNTADYEEIGFNDLINPQDDKNISIYEKSNYTIDGETIRKQVINSTTIRSKSQNVISHGEEVETSNLSSAYLTTLNNVIAIPDHVEELNCKTSNKIGLQNLKFQTEFVDTNIFESDQLITTETAETSKIVENNHVHNDIKFSSSNEDCEVTTKLKNHYNHYDNIFSQKVNKSHNSIKFDLKASQESDNSEKCITHNLTRSSLDITAHVNDILNNFNNESLVSTRNDDSYQNKTNNFKDQAIDLVIDLSQDLDTNLEERYENAEIIINRKLLEKVSSSESEADEQIKEQIRQELLRDFEKLHPKNDKLKNVKQRQKIYSSSQRKKTLKFGTKLNKTRYECVSSSESDSESIKTEKKAALIYKTRQKSLTSQHNSFKRNYSQNKVKQATAELETHSNVLRRNSSFNDLEAAKNNMLQTKYSTLKTDVHENVDFENVTCFNKKSSMSTEGSKDTIQNQNLHKTSGKFIQKSLMNLQQATCSKANSSLSVDPELNSENIFLEPNNFDSQIIKKNDKAFNVTFQSKQFKKYASLSALQDTNAVVIEENSSFKRNSSMNMKNTFEGDYPLCKIEELNIEEHNLLLSNTSFWRNRSVESSTSQESICISDEELNYSSMYNAPVKLNEKKVNLKNDDSDSSDCEIIDDNNTNEIKLDTLLKQFEIEITQINNSESQNPEKSKYVTMLESSPITSKMLSNKYKHRDNELPFNEPSTTIQTSMIRECLVSSPAQKKLHPRIRELGATKTKPKKSFESNQNEIFEDTLANLLEQTKVLNAIDIQANAQTSTPEKPSESQTKLMPIRNLNSPTGDQTAENIDLTPNRELIVKCRNITPMPNFDGMETPEIEKQLANYGLKKLKRRRGVDLLKYLYESTHPTFENLNHESDGEDRVVKRRRRLSLKGDSSKEKLVDTEVCPTGVVDVVGDVINLRESDEDMIFERKQSKKVSSCKVPLHITWHNFMAAHPEIMENLLLYEPLQVEVLYSMLKEQGFKYHIQDLVSFLDKKCITIRMSQNQGTAKRRH